MTLVLLAVAMLAIANKPMVSLEESCRKAAAVLVVEPATDAGTFKVLDILHDGAPDRIKKGQVIAVDLKGLVYEKGRTYILFVKPAEEAKRYQAVEQMRTEDGKDVRKRVLKLLAEIKENQ